jgi:hypothetical protein
LEIRTTEEKLLCVLTQKSPLIATVNILKTETPYVTIYDYDDDDYYYYGDDVDDGNDYDNFNGKCPE